MTDKREIDTDFVKEVKKIIDKIIKALNEEKSTLDNGTLFEKEMVINRIFSLRQHIGNHMKVARNYIRTGLNLKMNEAREPCEAAHSYTGAEGHHDLYTLSSCELNFKNDDDSDDKESGIHQARVPKHLKKKFEALMREMGIYL